MVVKVDRWLSKLIDGGCLFPEKKVYVKKQYEHFYVGMYHDPV